VAVDAASYIRLDGGRLMVHPEFREVLASHGLDSFDSLFAAKQGELLREIAGRGNVRLDLPEGVFFLKRHNRETFFHWLRHLLLLKRVCPPGRREFRNCFDLERIGIATALPVAFGEERRPLLYGRSLILSAKIAEAEPLNLYLERKFHPPLSREGMSKKRQLILQVADIARLFHKSLYNHRDFYLNHFFVREQSAGGVEIFLIDLQRMERRKYLRRRWLIKDIAALHYSADSSIISRTDRIRFLRRYLERRRLGPTEKAFARRVIRKARRIAQHDQKIARRARS